MPKLAIVVPYRDREEHLAKFVPHMERFLSEQGIDFKLFIIEQGDDNAFNRGWLLNVGYTLAKQQGFDYFCFHDIDMLPEDNTCDYSWVDKPTHLASRLSKFNYKLIYPEYFSGVTIETSAFLKAEVNAKLPIPPDTPTHNKINKSKDEVGNFHPPNIGIVNNEAIIPNIVKNRATM